MKTKIALTGPLAVCIAALLIGALPTTAWCQDETSSLDAEEAKEFLGVWIVSMEFGDMTLTFTDVDGKLASTLESDQQPEAQIITDITKSDEGLALKFDSSFGELHINLEIDNGELVGTLGDKDGNFSVELSGRRQGEGDSESGDLLAEEEGGDSEAARRARRRRLRAGNETKLTLAGEEVMVTYGNLPIDGPDYAQLATLKPGDIVAFTLSKATKLKTPLNLQFGDVIIKTENVAENYPGVYGLWIKKVDDGWRLVFNGRPDVWGTQHNPEADVAEIPLTYSENTEENEKLKIELVEEDSVGALAFTWGAHRWTTSFTAVD